LLWHLVSLDLKNIRLMIWLIVHDLLICCMKLLGIWKCLGDGRNEGDDAYLLIFLDFFVLVLIVLMSYMVLFYELLIR